MLGSLGIESYDVAVIGGGPNGLGIAAYLTKAGLSVCEEKLQCGGGAENTEPLPGTRVDPHATYLYGAASPFFEQIELYKFGLRMRYFKTLAGTTATDGKAIIVGRFNMEEAINFVKSYSLKYNEFINLRNFVESLAKGLLSSVFWMLPYHPDVWLLPYELLRFIKKETLELLLGYNDISEFSIYELLGKNFEFEHIRDLNK